MAERFDIRGLASDVMEKGLVDGAIATIVGSNKTDVQKYQAFNSVKTRILRNESYRSMDGVRALEELSVDPNLEEEDRIRVRHLLGESLRRQHWGVSNKYYLKDRSKMENIRMVKDPFYDFQLPEEVTKAYSIGRKQEVRDHNLHKKRSWEMATSDIENMRVAAMDFMQSDQDWTKRRNCLKLISALCLLTGRRKWELYKTLKMRCVPNESYQAEIKGLCKIQTVDDVWRRVPLLARYDLIVKAIVNLRQYKKLNYGDYGGPSLFGKSMTHTAYRNLFLEEAYKERMSINHFLIGDESCAPLNWKSQALGVSLDNCTQHYAVMSIYQDEPTDEPKRKRSHQQTRDMACQTDESGLHLLPGAL
jgi:hypothetical protein